MTPATEQHGTERIWILDIDGTLMPTRELDNRCYWRAVDDCVGGAPGCLDLDGFEHVTDAGILDEWMKREHGRPPSADEQRQIRRRFLALLIAEHDRQPAAFEPMPGLLSWLDGLPERPGTRIALATGGWAHTARFKLRAAGLERYHLPLASSDDDISRTGIMRIARQRSLLGCAHPADSEDQAPIIYVGDGVWDLRASRALGWRFVGIGSGPDARRLAAAGANPVFPDFRELAAWPVGDAEAQGKATRATA